MREFTDTAGRRWGAEIISHGRTSGYLNPRVHQAIVQFSCLDHRVPRRYVGYDGAEGLDQLSERDVLDLFDRSAAH